MLATQATDLDRIDNIQAVTNTAEALYAGGYIAGRDSDTAALVAVAQQNGPAATDARVELIARYAPRLRSMAIAARAGAAPDTDLQQAAMLGVLRALEDLRDQELRQDFFTYAYYYVRAELQDANREHAPEGATRQTYARYFEAMRAADGDPAIARRWSALQCLSIAELEEIAENGGPDEMLVREILDRRVDVYERHLARGYIGKGRGKGERKPVPAWEEYREQRGRGLDGATFDAIHAAVTYTDGSTPEPHDSEDCPTVFDVCADPDGTRAYDDVENTIAFDQMISTLDEREQKIIIAHMDGSTDREIASALGISRPRVVNIRSAAVAKLRRLADG